MPLCDDCKMERVCKYKSDYLKTYSKMLEINNLHEDGEHVFEPRLICKEAVRLLQSEVSPRETKVGYREGNQSV